MKDIQTIAKAFLEAAESGGVPEQWADSISAEEGFAIQIAVQALRDGKGDRRIGWKVAATNPVIQRQLGVTEPAFGSLRESKKYRSGHGLSVAGLAKPHVECELCFELDESINRAATLEDVAASVKRCFPAFEIIEKRVPISRFAAAMADNAEHTAIVLGEPIDARTITAYDKVVCNLRLNGEEVGSATGAAVLGNPLNSILWLKERLARYAQTLPAGSLIMTGSFLRQFPISERDEFVAQFSDVGAVSVRGVS